MKNKILPLALILCFFLTYSPSPACAGQLFTEHYGLLQVVEMSGLAILGSVVAINSKERKVTLLIKKIWHRPDKLPTLQVNIAKVDENGKNYLLIEEVTIELSKNLDLNIYTGVEWTDPNKSPLDHRLFGHLNLGEVKKGQDVIYAGKELLPSNTEITGRLDRIFNTNFKSEYPNKAKKEELLSDLNDYSLAKVAFAELLERKSASLRTLMSLKNSELSLGLLPILFEKTKETTGATLFNEAKAEFLSDYPIEIKSAILYQLISQAKPEMLGSAASFVNHLLFSKQSKIEKSQETYFFNSGVDRGNEILRKVEGKFTPSNVASIGQLYWSLKLMQVTNPDVDTLEHSTEKLLTDQKSDIRNQFVSSGFNSLTQYLNFKNHELNERAKMIIGILVKLIVERPDDYYVASITQLPVESVKSLEDKTSITQAMISMAVALVKKDSSLKSSLKTVIERNLKTEVTQFSTAKSDIGSELQVGISMNVESNLNSKEFDEYLKLFRE